MSAAFTPGPWETYQDNTTYYNGPEDDPHPFVIVAPNDGVILAVAVPNVVPQFEANAHLIAAAPELLEELEQQADGAATIIGLLKGQQSAVAVSLIGMLGMQEQAARAAIAKARGDQ